MGLVGFGGVVFCFGVGGICFCVGWLRGVMSVWVGGWRLGFGHGYQM
jgi:hypothetical protein